MNKVYVLTEYFRTLGLLFKTVDPSRINFNADDGNAITIASRHLDERFLFYKFDPSSTYQYLWFLKNSLLPILAICILIALSVNNSLYRPQAGTFYLYAPIVLSMIHIIYWSLRLFQERTFSKWHQYSSASIFASTLLILFIKLDAVLFAIHAFALLSVYIFDEVITNTGRMLFLGKPAYFKSKKHHMTIAVIEKESE
jgi:hypothetical protein